MRIVKWIAVGLFGLLVFAGVMSYFGPEHQAFLKFAAEREAWHRRCDVFRGAFTGSPEAQACKVELDAMVSLARARGWN